ncbi:MAG: hypothetical protein WBM69_23345 [Desulfobacterales bacterium]
MIHKISAILLACFFGLNLAAGGAVAAEPCLPSLCPSGLMDMGHHNGMINFAMPMQGCGEDCNDIFCGIMKDPLQDVNAVNSSPFQGIGYPVILATVDTFGQSGLRASGPESWHPLFNTWASSQIPLYLQHLVVII